MFGWLRELLEIKYEFRERRTRLTTEVKKDEVICQSCETLKTQLEIANYEKSQLLGKLLKEPEKESERTEAPPMNHVPRVVPWQVRRQMLEREDREKAKLLKNAPKPVVATTKVETEEDKKETELFEQELKNAEQARERTAQG
jgi:hypothetical protein